MLQTMLLYIGTAYRVSENCCSSTDSIVRSRQNLRAMEYLESVPLLVSVLILMLVVEEDQILVGIWSELGIGFAFPEVPDEFVSVDLFPYVNRIIKLFLHDVVGFESVGGSLDVQVDFEVNEVMVDVALSVRVHLEPSRCVAFLGEEGGENVATESKLRLDAPVLVEDDVVYVLVVVCDNHGAKDEGVVIHALHVYIVAVMIRLVVPSQGYTHVVLEQADRVLKHERFAQIVVHKIEEGRVLWTVNSGYHLVDLAAKEHDRIKHGRVHGLRGVTTVYRGYFLQRQLVHNPLVLESNVINVDALDGLHAKVELPSLPLHMMAFHSVSSAIGVVRPGTTHWLLGLRLPAEVQGRKQAPVVGIFGVQNWLYWHL